MKLIPILLAVAVLIGGGAVFLSVGSGALVYVPDADEITLTPIVDADIDMGNTEEVVSAMRLKIPKLMIDAEVEFVGINAKGNMASPAKYENVAWYQHGPRPGDLGSAVIAGHLDNGLGLRGVFEDLPSLMEGDDIYVIEEGGERLHFVVSEITTYPYNKVPTELLFNRKDDERLNLVTCVGDWLSKEKTYDARLIVYAKLVDNG